MKTDRQKLILELISGQDVGTQQQLLELLSARGVERPEEARRLLSPQSEPIPDPMLLRDMDRAAARVRLALERGERIPPPAAGCAMGWSLSPRRGTTPASC